jgi:FtsP/CotA-like multicopper oxidase with cupredoxin domain
LGLLDVSPLTFGPWNQPRPQTRHYDFTLTRQYLAPDGVNRSLLLVNGQYPGPTIEANLGDTIEVKVTNNIANPYEGTAIHWHGLSQKNSQWADGVPSVSQCPIAGGSSLTYKFTADVAGTTWWHAHLAAQYTDGLHGALIIHGPKIADYDIDLGPIFLSDYYHIDYASYLLPMYNFPPIFLPVENNLINGKMFFDCSQVSSGQQCTPNAAISKFRFQTGKTHRLRLINSGGATNQHFSVDGHEMTVIANDFVPVQPYKTKVVTLGVGQRTDVLIKATGKATDAVWMRSDLDEFCANNTIISPTGLAAVYYPKADKDARPKTTGYTWQSNACTNVRSHQSSRHSISDAN